MTLLLNQKEAAKALSVSERWLRDSDAPTTLLPSLLPGGRPLLRYDPEALRAWFKAYTVGRTA